MHFVDSDHPDVVAFAQEATAGAATDREKAVALFYAVRDAFNIELCERFGVLPQEFDGEHDALLHPFTADGREHMEYVRDRGSFDDVPFDEILAEFRSAYPGMFGASPAIDAAFRPS